MNAAQVSVLKSKVAKFLLKVARILPKLHCNKSFRFVHERIGDSIKVIRIWVDNNTLILKLKLQIITYG